MPTDSPNPSPEAVALLSEGLDLCVRARRLDEIDYAAISAELQCPRSLTIPLWVQDQYEKDVADWERRTRTFLLATPVQQEPSDE
jgi:hypothetical protein